MVYLYVQVFQEFVSWQLVSRKLARLVLFYLPLFHEFKSESTTDQKAFNLDFYTLKDLMGSDPGVGQKVKI